ncbi:receptor-type tyrosine-protein phosphatase beta-like isoform X3 [Sitophilus oryzae]|uniref:protein-tyrosine-phosphatase n=1 Tax=Sitophilus oryzae TaxID=7048 RepID=A0A6J2X7W6_SITOR|nr:receptor-type tyrosine-protein phosphatase beta-like isoform X3 [Sitophilus oryzae]
MRGFSCRFYLLYCIQVWWVLVVVAGTDDGTTSGTTNPTDQNYVSHEETTTTADNTTDIYTNAAFSDQDLNFTTPTTLSSETTHVTEGADYQQEQTTSSTTEEIKEFSTPKYSTDNTSLPNINNSDLLTSISSGVMEVPHQSTNITENVTVKSNLAIKARNYNIGSQDESMNNTDNNLNESLATEPSASSSTIISSSTIETTTSSTSETSTTQSSTTESSATQSSVTESPTTQDSTTEFSTTQNSTTESSTTQNSSTGTSTVTSSTTESSTTESSIITTSSTPTVATTTPSTTTTNPTPIDPQNLSIARLDSTSFNLTWEAPKDNTQTYIVTVNIKTSRKPAVVWSTCDIGNDRQDEVSCCSYVYNDAMVGVNYTIGVKATNGNVNGSEVSWSGMPLPVPEPPIFYENVSISDISTNTAIVNLASSNDDVLYWAITIWNEDITEEQEYCLWTNTMWPSLNTTLAYQASPKFWTPFFDSSNPSFQLGTNSSCSENEPYCNRELQSDTKYYIVISYFYRNYYGSKLLASFVTEKQRNLGLILGLVFGLLFISVMGFLGFLLWRKGIFKRKNKPIIITAGRNVKVKEFIAYCDYLEQNPDVQKDEWEKLNEDSKNNDVEFKTAFATLPENRRKNRYPNILPWDHCRVKLNIDEDDEICSDYINASYVKGYSNEVEYIATQGPLPGTCRDFWKMVIQENVTIIVMVSKFIENNRDKCYKYFPNNHQIMTVGDDIEVRCSTELHLGVYCIRTLQVKKDLVQVNVTHMQYLDWPDFGVPTDTGDILQFCSNLRSRWSQGGLALVHCSAGVGRTGTLVATDILLQAINSESRISVYNTVLEMRKQRKNMVQTQKQYMYIYQLVKNMLEAPIINEEYDKEPVYENITVNDNRNSGVSLKNQDETDIETAESAF